MTFFRFSFSSLHRARTVFTVGAALSLAAVAPSNLRAQSLISGDLAGTVVDASGAVVPGASVTIKNTDTGATTTLTTSSSGLFHGSLLKPGHYVVDVTAPNFQPAEQQASIAVGQTANVTVTLSIGQGTQTVHVEGNTVSLLQPENSDLGTTIDMQQVQSLPNPGGDITYYINLTQGVVMNTQGGYGNSSAFGLPATSNNFTINGAEDNDPFLNLNNSGPSNLLLGSNDIGEVNIVANAYSAQYGSLGGIQENIISRSGANSFHGNATYWWTNSDINANDWFNDHDAEAQPFANANQWAAAVGGPIVKDKTFFFVNYESLRFVTSPADFVEIPSPTYQASVLANIAQVSPSQLPFYRNMFNLYNNAPGAASATPYTTYANAFEADPRNNLAEWLLTARVDHKLGPNDNMFVHFKYDHGVQPTYVDPINSAFNADSNQPDYEGQLEETHTFTPNLVNQFIFSTAWYGAYFVSTNPTLAASTFPYGLDFVDGSFTGLGGEPYAWPEGRDVTQYQFSDDLSWTKGKHTLSFGGIFKRDDVTDADLGEYTTPLAEELGPAEGYNGTGTTNGATNITAGDDFGNGGMYVGVQNFPQRLTEPIAVYNMGFYVQDQWKVTSNLQLTGGVRVEHNSNPVCVTDCFARFPGSYSSVVDTQDTPYDKELSTGLRNAFPDLQKFTIDPRVGFTYSPNSKSVLRGGFGMFTDIFPATTADYLLDNAPLNPEFVVVGGNADPSAAGSFTSQLSSVNSSFSSGFASGGTFNSIATANPNFLNAPPVVYNADSKIDYPTYEEWSLQYQQQVGKYTSFQVGYVGNHGYHEPFINNGVNASEEGVYGGTFNGLPATQALPSYGEIQEIESGASSNYNGFVATVKHESKPLTIMFNYTYSHALDEISNGGFLPFGGNGTSPINPFNLAQQNYGNADYDIRHNFNGSYIYRLPSFGGPKLLTDGWQVSGTIFWHTGFPFSVTDSTATTIVDGAGTYGGGVLADIINPSVPHHCGKDIDTGCFGPTALGTYFADPTSFGGQRRNQFTGPGYFNSDIGLTKSFKVPGLEEGMLQVGAQAYNFLNHPDFANPVFDADNPSVGQSSQLSACPPVSSDHSWEATLRRVSFS